ncbi:hypothetical protein CVT24_011483 [Panaeolus cyanescens]|uniref:Uncharacterized protein n=1 Tax=Panaeolus cyanescens TaxID=181874 RepID=A0A409VGJ1_9AGAR|nr:hypothetical protein CVT24_011483 [Panaeolus cyanescens]
MSEGTSAPLSMLPVTLLTTGDSECSVNHSNDPTHIHLAQNTMHGTCDKKEDSDLSESYESSPGSRPDQKLEAKEKERTGHSPRPTSTLVHGTPLVPQSPASSVNSDEFYTPEISQDVFPSLTPMVTLDIVEAPESQGSLPHYPENCVSFGFSETAEIIINGSSSGSTPFADDTNNTELLTTDTADELEAYWRQAHVCSSVLSVPSALIYDLAQQRLVSSIMDVPHHSVQPTTLQKPNKASPLDDNIDQAGLLTRSQRETHHEQHLSPSTHAYKTPNALSLWVPPSTSQAVPHTPERPNWALAPDESPSAHSKSTGNRRRSKNRSGRPERSPRHEKPWASLSPSEGAKSLGKPNMRSLEIAHCYRHMQVNDRDPDISERDVIATFSPSKTKEISSIPAGSFHMGVDHIAPKQSSPPQKIHRNDVASTLDVTGIANSPPILIQDTCQEHHAEILRQNQALIELLRSHQHCATDYSSSYHHRPQQIQEDVTPPEHTPVDAHHALGPQINEKGFQRSRTTVNPNTKNNEHALKRRASWRKSISLPTILEATAGGQISASYHTFNEIDAIDHSPFELYRVQDPISIDHNTFQKGGGFYKQDIHGVGIQIKWPSQSEETAFHESAHPILSWNHAGNGYGHSTPLPNVSALSHRLKEPGTEVLTDALSRDLLQHTVMLEDNHTSTWHASRPTERPQVERAIQDPTASKLRTRVHGELPRSSSFMSNIPIAVRLQRKPSLTNQHINKAERNGGMISPSSYTSNPGCESKIPQMQSNWSAKPGSTQIARDWRQQSGTSSSPMLHTAISESVDHTGQPVYKARSEKRMNKSGSSVDSVGGTTRSQTIAPMHRLFSSAQMSSRAQFVDPSNKHSQAPILQPRTLGDLHGSVVSVEKRKSYAIGGSPLGDQSGSTQYPYKPVDQASGSMSIQRPSNSPATDCGEDDRDG